MTTHLSPEVGILERRTRLGTRRAEAPPFHTVLIATVRLPALRSVFVGLGNVYFERVLLVRSGYTGGSRPLRC